MADLDRLIRLEEFLREEQKTEQTQIFIEWVDSSGKKLEQCEAECDRGSEEQESSES
jgi:hypothetical protein